MLKLLGAKGIQKRERSRALTGTLPLKALI